jgi:tetratricopeptide (TPR) repeat protein
MKTKSAVLALLLTISSGFVLSQLSETSIREFASTADQAELIKESSTLTKDEFFYYAEIFVDKLLELEPNSPNLHYRKGFLRLKIQKDYNSAIPHLEKAVKNVSQNYDMYSHKEKKAPIDAHFYLGKSYHLKGEVEKAIVQFKKFQELSVEDSELLPLAAYHLKQCAQAKDLMTKSVDVTLTNIGSTINTTVDEYSSVVSMDGSALYFTSRRAWPNNESDTSRDERTNALPEDVYVSFMKDDSTWEDPIKLGFCKPEQNEASISVNSNDRTINLYSDESGGDIYTSDFYHAKFQDIEKIDLEHVNSGNWENHCMMSHDQNFFFFVSDRPGGYGGSDIYLIERNANGKWSEPRNLGSGINTPYDEDAPFIAADNKTLFYASNGEKSMGEFDLFRSEMQSTGSWTEGVNLGYPFNSTNVDTYYTTTLDGSRGYITTNRNDSHGNLDIYEVYSEELRINKFQTVLQGKINTVGDKDIPDDLAIAAVITCLDCETEDTRQIYPRLRDGVFMAGVEPGKTYKLEYKDLVNDVVMEEETFTTRLDPSKQELNLTALVDVDKKTVIDTDNSFAVNAEEENTNTDATISDTASDTITNTESNLSPNGTDETGTDVDNTAVDVAPSKNLEFMHYFGYNRNKLNINHGGFRKFIKEIEAQLNKGRQSITINIYSSASKVPTKTFGTNQKLAEIRAENMKSSLINYFEKKSALKGKVNISIVTSTIQGPEYEEDAANQEKYKPYQYVGLKTE